MCILLAAASIYAIVTAAEVPEDVTMVKNYWLDMKAASGGKVDMIIEGIGLIAENMQAYLDGAAQYEEGKQQLEDGKEQIAEGELQLYNGQAQYNDGTQQLSDAKITYNEYVAQVEEGKIQLEAGKEQLAQGEAELAAGKAKLAAVQPIYNAVMPIYQNYNEALNKYNEAAATYEEATANGNFVAATAAQWAMNSAKEDLNKLNIAMGIQLSGYTIESLISEYEAGQVKLAEGEAEVEAGRQQIAEGEARLADAERQLAEGKVQIEEGEQQLEQGKQQLDNAYVQYWAGLKQLADGEQQLADGLEQLTMFEDGEAQLVDGIELAMGMEGYTSKSGYKVVPSIKDRLDPDFTYWKLDENGRQVIAHGKTVLDTDKANEVAAAAKDFMADIQSATTKELISRYVFAGITVLVAALGIAAAVLGFLRSSEIAKAFTFGCTIIATAATTVKFVFFREITMSIAAGSTQNGRLSLAMLILSLVMAAFFMVFALGAEPADELDGLDFLRY